MTRVFDAAKGKRVQIRKRVGTTDTRHDLDMAENRFRLLSLRIKPDDTKRFHGTDERISISNYEEIIRFYVQLLGGRGSS